MAHRKRKLVLRFFAALVLLSLILAVALPLWFPWVLRPIAKSLGLSYTRYERNGYSRFRLTNLALTSGGTAIQAEQAQAFIPTVWLWKVVRHDTNNPFLQVNSWAYRHVTNSAAQSRPAASVYTNVAALNKTFAALRKWLPNAALTNGTIQAGSKIFINVSEAHWLKGELIARTTFPENRPVRLQLKAADASLRLQAAAETLNFFSNLTVTNAGSLLQLQSVTFWQSNRIEFEARFARTGSLPSNASLRVDHFEIPAEVVKLENYRDVAGSLNASWSSVEAESIPERAHQKFQINLIATAAPLKPDLPPIDFIIQASGNTDSARIDIAKVTLPWLNAELSRGTELQFSPPFLPEPTQLKVSADLTRQTRFPARGTLQGNATLFPGTNRYPRVSFALAGSGISVSNLQTRTLEFAGELNWPQATILSSKVTMNDNSEASLTGVLNLASNMVERGEANVVGTFGRELLPAGYSYQHIVLHSEVSGPFKSLSHSGKFELTQLQVPNFNPVQLSAEWRGAGLNADYADVRLNASNAFLRANVFLAGTNTVHSLTISNLTLHTSRHGDLILEQPSRATLERNVVVATNAPAHWQLRVEPLRWIGGDRKLEVAANLNWPERGEIQIAATNLGSELMEDFLPVTNADVNLNQLVFKAGWTNGPVNFSGHGSASLKTKDGYEFAMAGAVSGDDAGVLIQQLSIASATQIVCRAEGSLPFVLTPGDTNNMVQIRDDGPLQLRAFTETNSILWEELGKKIPLNLANPNVRADLAGTWRKPQGTMTAVIDRLEMRSTKPLPVVSNLNFDLKMDRESAVSHLQALIQDQPVRASARIPLGQGFWAGLQRERHLPDFQNATGQLEIQNAKIASFVEFAPRILTPQGEFNLNMQLERGNRLLGEVLVYNAGTRPLATLGPIRAIDARILFSGSELSLTNLSAEIGGQRITATGRAQVPEQFWNNRALPDFQLHVFGTNVPLVRQANVLVRADLDLAITNTLKTNGMVMGRVRLHDSFFLSSLADLTPGRVASPKRRPPFFSIEAEPFAAWRLGVQVEGEKFLRVRSPLFTGTASTTLRVEGTLKEPLALGEARINSGIVTFPFGSLDVQQGYVSLTSADPYHPRLFVNAGAQRLGYDIKMEATGPADQPVLQFSSSPPLSSEQIVLMLTTGQTPQGVAASSTRQRAQGLAMFVGKNLLSDLGIGGGGEGRLTVRSGEQLTETGRSTYDVEYKLTEDWSLVGEYDRFSQYNLGVKWRVYSK